MPEVVEFDGFQVRLSREGTVLNPSTVAPFVPLTTVIDSKGRPRTVVDETRPTFVPTLTTLRYGTNGTVVDTAAPASADASKAGSVPDADDGARGDVLGITVLMLLFGVILLAVVFVARRA